MHTDKMNKKSRYVCVSSVCIGVVEMTMMEKDIVVDLVVLLLPRSTHDAAALLPTTICEFPPHLLAGPVSPAALALVVTVHSSALGLSTGARTPLLLLHLLFLLHRKWAVDGELVVLLALAGVDVEVPPWFWSEVPRADVGVLGGRRRRGAVDGEGCKGTAGILGAILYLANVRVYGGGGGTVQEWSLTAMGMGAEQGSVANHLENLLREVWVEERGVGSGPRGGGQTAKEGGRVQVPPCVVLSACTRGRAMTCSVS